MQIWGGAQKMSMVELPGAPPIMVELRRSSRAKRVSLRVSRLDGRVSLTLPLRLREADALTFLRAQEGWLRQNLAKSAALEVVSIGSTLPVEGRMVALQQGTGRAPQLSEAGLLIPGAPERAGVRAQAFLKARARDRLAQASDHYAGQLGQRYQSLTLRDTRSRWGSCTAQGGLMYNWRLIMAPPVVLDYVAAHEVAHLVEMNHSDAFWAVVARLMPDYATPRAWLKREGHHLHGYRFSAP